MGEPLTPEEARKTADDMDWSVAAFEASDQEACHIFYDRDVAEVAATLRAYADQAERLKEMEEAVGEYFRQNDEHARAMTAAIDAHLAGQFEGETKKVREASVRMDAAEARLRSLVGGE